MRLDVDDFQKFVIIGDRVLIKPRKADLKTKTGLYLPPTVQENEQIHSGYVIKVGPGYPLPSPIEDESWKKEGIKYIPLQSKEGDLAIYLQNQAHEIEFNKEKYVILPQASILMLIRDEDLFD